MNRLITILAVLALALAVVISTQSLALAFVLLFAVSALLNFQRRDKCCLTLSVNELLGEVLQAFKTTLVDLIDLTTDFSTDTAVKDTVLTGHIAQLPALADYDVTTGFANSATAVENLLVDVPVTLSNLKHVPIRIKWLTEISSKQDLIPKANEIAYTLVKWVIDSIVSQALTNVSSNTFITPISMDLDAMEALRGSCNAQRMGSPRHLILNSTLAEALGLDGRILSALFYDQRNGEQALHRWKNVAGFRSIVEYPDFGNSTYGGLALDKRLVCLSVRSIADMTNVARELGVPEIMSFDTASDSESKLSMTAVKYQEPGTGDVLLSFAVLFGIHCGTGTGGSPLDKTDRAGLLIRQA